MRRSEETKTGAPVRNYRTRRMCLTLSLTVRVSIRVC